MRPLMPSSPPAPSRIHRQPQSTTTPTSSPGRAPQPFAPTTASNVQATWPKTCSRPSAMICSRSVAQTGHLW